MSLNRYAKARDANEAEVFQALRIAGAVVYPMDRPVNALASYRGVTHLIEVKARKGKLTKAQQAFLSEWTGQPVHILRSFDEAMAFMRSLQVDPNPRTPFQMDPA